MQEGRKPRERKANVGAGNSPWGALGTAPLPFEGERGQKDLGPFWIILS